MICILPVLLCLSALPQSESEPVLKRVLVQDPESEELATSLEQVGFDVVEGSVRPGSFELVVGEDSLAELNRFGLSPTVLEVGRPFADILRERREAAEDSGQDSIPEDYPTLSQVVSTLLDTANTYPGIVQLVDLNTQYGLPLTAEGRRLWAVKVSDNVTQDEDEPAIFIHAGAHAREVVPPVVALDTLSRITTLYGVDPDITASVDQNEIWILPVANPDGYVHAFTTNNLWRKNRMVYPGGIGVDLNRNYSFGWTSSCAGSTNIADETYKGPSAESEVETQAVVALSRDKNFAKVLDFHSYGQAVWWEYGCGTHPLAALLMYQAIALSNLAGWNGNHDKPPANGLHFHWQLAEFQAFAFHIQTLGCCSFQPAFATAQAEAATVWPVTRFMLERFIDVSGNVTDACTGAPVVASIAYEGRPFTLGEKNTSEPDFGRYHAWLPEGNEIILFSAPGYLSQAHPVTILPNGGVTLDVQLQRSVGSASAATRNGGGTNPSCYRTLSPPTLGGSWVGEVAHDFYPGATATAVVMYTAPGSGTFVRGGEVLVSLAAPRVFSSILPATGNKNEHAGSIPNDPCLGNLFAASQAAVLGGSYVLCNAEDLTTGY